MPVHPPLPISKALIRLLKTTFTNEEVLLISKAYNEKSEEVGADLFHRGEISFNPRLCRITQILIEDIGVKNAGELIAEIRKVGADAVLPNLDDQQITPCIYADTLDRLRHAHLYLTNEELSCVAEFARSLPKMNNKKISEKIDYLLSKLKPH